MNIAKDNKINSYKIVLIGDSFVGKSSIMERYINDKFAEYQEVTIGSSFATKNIMVDNHQISLKMWDTAGQERYQSLTPMYYKDAMGAVIVYDITKQISFDNAKKWLQEIKNYRQEECKIIMVGNKIDLEDKRQVSDNLEKQLNQENIQLIKSSAKTGFNVNHIFQELSKMIIKEDKQNQLCLDNKKISKKKRCF